MSGDTTKSKRTLGRRDVLIGASCVAALGVAEWLRPRNVVRLMEGTSLDDIVPAKFGDWSSAADSGLIIPETPNSLADRLYSDTTARRYTNQATGVEVMLLIAYGGAQSDLLQLHRPESCYPAVGFEIVERQLRNVNVGSAIIPAVALTAQAASRKEDILYFTRLGEFLPQTAAQQRSDRLSTAMDGYIGDGMLVRASVSREGDMAESEQLDDFMTQLVKAIKPKDRAAFIGTERAGKLAA